jgi:uncharacterized protein (TIGR00369 family)
MPAAAHASFLEPMSTSERLAKYAELLNAHPSLASYGVRLTFPDEQRLRIEVGHIAASMRGGMGDDAVVNGGVLSALCDLMIGSAAGLVDPGTRSATVQLSIRFERPLRGERIVGEARVDHSTGRTIFSSGELSDDQGRVCVRCQGLATLLRPTALASGAPSGDPSP